MNGHLSHTEAQRFLAAIVTAEISRIRAERYAEPLDQSPSDWIARASSERVRRAAMEIVSARGTAAILLAHDERRLWEEGYDPEEIAAVGQELGRLVDWIACPKQRAEVERATLQTIGRHPSDDRETRLLQCLHLSGQAEALSTMDRVRATGPMISPGVGIREGNIGRATGLGGTASSLSLTSPNGARASVAPMSDADTPGGGAWSEGSRAIPGPQPCEVNSSKTVIRAVPEARDDREFLSQIADAMIGKLFPPATTDAAEKSVAKDRRQTRQVLAQFIEITGDKPMCDLTQADCGHYVDTLACLPKVYGRSKADRDRSISELIERGEDLPDDEVGLAANTINRNIGHLQKLLKYARGRGMRPAEDLYLSDLRATDRRDARSVREPFTEEDLAALSRHTVWKGCQSAGRRNLPGCEIIQDGLYWGPLLAAYSGARREELMGMKLAEVNDSGPIPFLRLQPNGNRRLKNPAAERDIPLHRRLIDLGLLEYVARLRIEGEVDLFPELAPKSVNETFGGNLYKKWTESKNCVLGDGGRRKTFHSFRHTVVTRLRHDPNIPKLFVTTLVGHTPHGETDGRYTKKVDLAKLTEVVNSLPDWF
ncbi:site-specific integrase [Jannaschia donghaensis]|nr:site-specific integrase [Jannaschia donghaensis]